MPHASNWLYDFRNIRQPFAPETFPTYWGSMEEAHASTGLALKRMTMKAGCQSSLEVHVKKHEIYWLMSGELEIGLRTGRAENSVVTLKAGECFEIPPGLLHMRMAVTDCVILEAASVDSPDDTHIVEDGRTYTHKVAP